MKSVKPVLIAILLLSLCSPLSARADLIPGHLDTGFDAGGGADAEVLAVAVQADDKVLIGGNFATVDGTGRNRIARLDADGALDATFDPGSGADGRVRAITVQPDGRILIGGNFTTINGVARNRVARLQADGTLDTTFDPGTGADAAIRSMVILASGKVLVAGEFTTINGTGRNRIARLNADGSLDTSFDPGSGASATIYELAVQADGKVVIAGNFTSVNGTTRNRVARLSATGSLDTTFDPGSGANSWVSAMTLQSDGKVLIGGAFSQVASNARNRIARLNSDGSLDASFDPGDGASAVVNTIEVQADGKAVIGGAFSTIDGVTRGRFARLDSDGSLDLSFDPGAGADANVWDVAIQDDGKVLISGNFTTVDSTTCNRIARAHVDGSLDIGFDPGTGANALVRAIIYQPDGKVLIGGSFTTVDGTSRYRIARLDADGALNATVAPVIGGGSVQDMAIQDNGKILIGGTFSTVDGIGRAGIARLNADGTLDHTFDPGSGANDIVYALALQADGKVLVGGTFTTVDGTARNHIARLDANGSLDTTFNPGSGVDEYVYAIAVQADGRVLIGGNFTSMNSTTRRRIARLNSNGRLDTTFDPGDGASSLVRAIVIQPDGRIIIAGTFTTVDGVARGRIARLKADGSLDKTFDPGGGANNWVETVALQPNGQMIIGGTFTAVDGRTCNRVARLNADGALDTTFDTRVGANDTIYAVTIQSDEKVLIGGTFTSLEGEALNRIARLNGTSSPLVVYLPLVVRG